MKQKKLRVTVGIPAFNEEANIGYLLESLARQRETGFEIDKILVSSDGSTDRTADIVRGFGDKRIHLLNNKNRQGQAFRQNQLAKISTGDIFVLLEADTLPVNENFMKNLIAPFKTKKHPKIGLTYGTSTPLAPRNFFERIMYFKTNLKKRIYQGAISKNKLQAYSGQSGRAFSKTFARKMYWPSDAPEDTYCLLLCNQMGYEALNARSAEMYYRLPGNFVDYYRQYTKFIRGRQALLKYFSETEMTKLDNYRFPLAVSIYELVRSALRNPVMMFLYVCVFLVVHLRNFKMESFHPFLEIYPSSKKLI